MINLGSPYIVPVAPKTNRRLRCAKPTRNWPRITIIAVNGETEFNDVGMSHGFVHFKDPVTGACRGFCGVSWFEEYAVPVTKT